jgi:hypothetical protein
VDAGTTNKFLMLTVVGLAVALVLSVSSTRTAAGTESSSGGIAAVTGNIESQSRDLLYVVDTTAKVLCVYDFQGGKLNLVGARNIKFDLMLDEWRPDSQNPSVKQVYEAVKQKIQGSSTPPRK